MASRAGPPLRRRRALLALAVLSCLQLAASQLSSTRPLPRPAATATEPLEEVGGGVARRACTYTVEIKTSCSSPRASPDAVSLAFGDAYRNEVYAARVSPAYGFERCARDTFRVSGPCGYGVCYLYLRRSGGVGWTPEWVRVYEPASATPSTFHFGDPLPNGVWYGLDRCLRRPAARASQ
ncbi:hypothetical protein GQ55_5G495900 [Panicum hallii var. hallii]|jgi:hypothetical protein|uniref:Embryo-specific protein ATS3A n=2 Tax=Panicum hallii TaxID=206008 RepID=A0A2T7DRR7_9POAL|nr:embryo-specific protein ATS3A-like [Panicum hallii]PUZ58273.1 hypothetical protein GQ55_5G495900 [Panicum hallii var. hallii]PVH39391.1 hypothetical protein PAHAL_5G491000 [Panicum hallii]